MAAPGNLSPRAVKLTAAGVVVASLAVARLAVGQARAADGNVERGAQVADQWCTACHATGTSGRASDGAPAFYEIANRQQVSGAHLRAFLADPHGAMEGFSLPRREIDDLAAYIMSLREY